ncbi:Uncharacterised protein [Candidatus Gugararchaeum adminiculabundum]|nr:Uncharacterised protein [Candidatus Gugararchaeum adminiculabundum]
MSLAEPLSYILLASVVCAVVMKLVDELADNHVNLKGAEVFAVGYGFILAWLATRAELFPVFLALTIGVFAAGKIDHILHYIGLATFIVLFLFFYLTAAPGTQPAITLAPLILLVFLSLASYSDEQPASRFPKFLAYAVENRLFLEVATIIAAIATNNAILVLSLISFDIAYKVTAKSMQGVQYSSVKK